MYSKIMVPIDLAHTDRLGKALAVTGKLAAAFGAEVHLVGVAERVPSSAARDPREFAEKLEAYAGEQTRTLGIPCTAHAKIVLDLGAELEAGLVESAEEIGADLVVMASHAPNFLDRIFGSNAGALAAHANLSVFVVR